MDLVPSLLTPLIWDHYCQFPWACIDEVATRAVAFDGTSPNTHVLRSFSVLDTSFICKFDVSPVYIKNKKQIWAVSSMNVP